MATPFICFSLGNNWRPHANPSNEEELSGLQPWREIWRGAAVSKQAETVLHLLATSPLLPLYPQHTFALKFPTFATFFYFFGAFSEKEKPYLQQEHVNQQHPLYLMRVLRFVVWKRAGSEKQGNRASRTFSRRRLWVIAFYMFVYTSSHHRQTQTNNSESPRHPTGAACVNLIGSGTNDVRPQRASEFPVSPVSRDTAWERKIIQKHL